MADPWVALLTGPVGGLLATAFGTGCVSGYSFAVRTALKVARDRIEEISAASRRDHDDCERRLSKMEDQLQDMRDILMGKKPMPPFSAVLPGALDPGIERLLDEPPRRPRTRKKQGD